MSAQKLKLLALSLGLLGLFAWVILTKGPLAPVKVTVETVQTGTLSDAVFGVGTVLARRSVNLAPTLNGRVKRVLVDQGDRVRAGQVLAEMDVVDLDDKLAGGQRAVERAAHQVLAAQALKSEAQSRLTTLSATLKRYDDLQARGFVSREMWEAKSHEKNAAASALAAASANLGAAREEHGRAQADLRGITKARAHTRLVSPINGVVVARFAEPGSTLAGGQVALQVVDPDSLWVVARIAQQQAGRVRVGQAAEILLRSQPDAPLAGKVARMERVSDALTEERIVNVSFQADAASIGEYAEVTLDLGELNNVRNIASAAVKRLDKQAGVWVLRDGKVTFKPVKTGLSTLDGRTQIVDGLDESDTVIVYSQQPMRAGLKVKVVPELVKG